MGHEKTGKKRDAGGRLLLALSFFLLFFAPPFFRAAQQLTELLKEATRLIVFLNSCTVRIYKAALRSPAFTMTIKYNLELMEFYVYEGF